MDDGNVPVFLIALLLLLGGGVLGVWMVILGRRARMLALSKAEVEAKAAEHSAIQSTSKANEERLREFSEAAADWLWEIDANYRCTMDTGQKPVGGLTGSKILGLARWEMPGADPRDPHWDRYRAMLDMHETFRDFEFYYAGEDGGRHHASISGRPLFAADGTFVGYRGTGRDITPEVEAKAKIDRTNALLDAVRQIQGGYIAGAEKKATCEQMLSIVLRLSGSAFGFVGEILTDTEGQRYFKAHALTNIAWDDATRKLYDDSAVNGLEFRNLDTLFGAVIRTEQAVIANDPANDPRRGSLPQNHPPLNSFLGLPMLAGKTMVGMLGIANRPGGYEQEVVDFLEPFAGACGAVLAAIQADAEQARVAAELRLTDERLQTTLESTGVGPWEWDLATGAFKIDPGTIRKLGYGPDEIAPTIDAWDALMHPDDRKTVEARFSDVDKPTAETFEAVYRMRMKQGGWRWLLTRARVIQRDAAGHPTRIIGTHLDITDVKKTEIALRRSEERFRSLAESSRAVPWEADIATFQITYVGPQIERITGYSPADWVEKDLWPQRLHPDDRDRAMKDVEVLASEGSDHNLEYRLIAADGRVVWIRDMVSVIKSDDGQRWLYGVMVDVTEGKQREQALRESEQRYRQAERVAGILHWSAVADTDVWKDAHITFSETSAPFLGVVQGELDLTNDQFYSAFVHPDDRERVIQQLRHVTAERRPDYSIEYRIIRKNGSIAAVSELGQHRYDATGRVASAFGTIQDITDRKSAENALRRAQMDAEMANRAKSQFLANVSHELRTPLNAIIGFSEVMKDELMGPLGAGIYKEYSGDIHDSGRHLLAIINDILDLSRVESGQATLNEAEIEVPSMIEACLILIRGKADAGALTVTTEMAPRLPAIYGDERLLKQALLNLLSNAVKFTPRGGSVKVKATLTGDGLDISVIDSGIGMSAAELEQVARPFVQLENWLVRKYEGTGLGLSIVKAFCELHGGSLEISSEPGRGTTTTIRLPAARILSAEPTRAHAE
jgi:PAS domain S-box-containing protein